MIKTDNKPSASAYKVCSDCGITHTPLWRGGPNGPKTMCNACGIRWKRAHQNGHKPSKSYNDQKLSKIGYISEEEEEYDSAEELLALSDPESSTPRTHTKDSKDFAPRSKKSLKKKSYQLSKATPYARRNSISDAELEHQAEDSMMLLQQAAEEFDKIPTAPATEGLETASPVANSLTGSANASPVPINTLSMTPTPAPLDTTKADQLLNEVIALRQEVQKRDAIIDMYKTSPMSTNDASTNFAAIYSPPALHAM